MKIHLVFGLITVLALVIVIGSRRQETFSFDTVAQVAQKMAQEGYLTTSPALPKSLRGLTPDEYAQIEWKEDRTLWRRDGLPFQVRFVYPGPKADRQVRMFELSKQGPEEISYSSTAFNFGGDLAGLRPPTLIGYAGFRLFYPLNKPDALDELLSFIGDTNFRAVARNLIYGVTARALVVDPAGDRGFQETPVFTRFLLQRPDAFATQFTLYALLESGSVTGAYQFDIEPGNETKITVRARLYFKEKLDRVGYAPLASMFWFGESTSNTFGDFRPEVHKSDGLLLQKNNGEWIWHPLTWSSEAQTNIFDDAGPKGFGLFQRDRDFSHYQDLKSLYHKLPSVWVQPIKGFENGRVFLTQAPAKGDDVDNVLAYWVPNVKPVPLQPVDIEYVVRWFGDNADLPPLGRCVSTRVDLQNEENRRQFFLEFAGSPVDKLKQGEAPVAEIASETGAQISDIKIERNDFNKTWRVSFLVTANQKSKPTEILCRLMSGANALTETWTYTWIP